MADLSQTVWVSINCEAVAQDLRDYMTKGLLAEVNKQTYLLQSFLDKIKSFVMSKGGSMSVCLYDRSVLQLPLSACEELPKIIEDYQDRLKHKIAVGVGLTFGEANKAAEKSWRTGEIELFEPENEADVTAEGYGKSETDDSPDHFEVPPNLFDPKLPSPEDDKLNMQAQYQPKKPEKPVLRPDMQTELQSEKQLLDGINAQVAPPQAPGGPQGGGQPPQDLMEALHGGPVPGREQQQGQPQNGADSNNPASPEGSQEAQGEQELTSEVDEAEKEAEQTNQKLAQLLLTVKQQIPQIMQLHQSNPEAFKQSMAMINKLVQLAHGRKKVTKKELEQHTESLTKAFGRRLANWKGHTKVKLPVGTIKRGKKKVLFQGKEAWRSVRAGQVKDSQGLAISVKSSNYEAEHPKQDQPKQTQTQAAPTQAKE